MEEKINKKSYIALMIVSVLCLIVIVTSATYAYFRPKITGEGSPINVSTGKVKLNISESKIIANGLAPILDETKDSKAQKNTFTISRSNDSTLEACYSLTLEIDSIGVNLRNGFFKYEFEYDNGKKITGDFSGLIYNDEGKSSLPLLINQSLNDDVTEKTYTLKLWLSYSPTEDQTSLLTGDASTRTFNAHIKASGYNGACKLD